MRTGLRALAVVVIGLVIVTARVLWSSHVEWREGEALLARGESARAVDRFGRAARLYAPGNPWSSRALDRIEEIAQRAEAAKDEEAALSAWRELRAAALATRAIYAPNAARRLVADEHIAALAAALESPAVDPGANGPTARAGSEAVGHPTAKNDNEAAQSRPGAARLGGLAAQRRWHAERLARTDEPNVAWSVVALLGFALWVGAAVGFLLRAIDERDRLRRSSAIAWALGFLAGVALFALGLGRA